MANFFVTLYNFFERHKIAFYLSLIASIAIMVYFVLQLKFEENITRFFPDTENEKNLNEVFSNLRVKDKIIVMFSSPDSLQSTDREGLEDVATRFKDSLETKAGSSYIKNIILEIDQNTKSQMQDFVYNNLPVFLSDSDYQRMDSLFSEGNIHAIMQKNYSNLLSPAGFAIKDYVMKDPLGLGGNSLKRLQDFQLDTDFEQDNGYIFTKDKSMLLMFISPTHGMGSTGENDKLVSAIESEIASFQKDFSSVKIEYYGGPSVSVYNARQIKSDSMLTSTIALIIIIIFTSLVFKQKKTIPLIITPVLFGGLFSLAVIYLIKGSISSIAVGSGSVVLGIAMSYSIHMIVHQGHVSNVQQLIKELTYPLTVGSFTTIGAFLGLLFTTSDMLRDFGLFAAMALIGTTLFCLIYLPHFLKGEIHRKKGRLLHFIEKFNSYHFDKNKWLVASIVILTVICFFTSNNVVFDSDMMRMNYEPKHLKETERKLMDIVEGNKKTILFVSVGKNMDEATAHYNETNKKLSELKSEGLINNYASADYFLIPQEIQKERLKRWNQFWTADKKDKVKTAIEKESLKLGFRSNAFDKFYEWLDQDFSKQNELYNKGGLHSNTLLTEWQNNTDNLTMLISQVQLDDKHKEFVYQHFSDANKVVIFDRGYFTQKWVSAINDDFYLVLFISSFLIFFTLLISYGRIELALISFLPMFVSWIIIIGIMGIMGIKFNIVNIILSTFIFGIGDDFSIFIMDGLLNKYRTRKSVLEGHKTAIFFSAFTIIVGMGALLFAKHPALQSISVMSILGMIVVVLVSYTVPPIVFRLLISNPTAKGFPPYTLFSIFVTFGFYSFFVVGCLVLRFIALLLHIVPIKKKQKRAIVCYLIMITCKLMTSMAFVIRLKKINITKTIFDKPSIIIANHQSFLDIVFLLSLSPKMVMVTNHWVWNSPFFGSIIRYAGYFYNGEGYETSITHLEERLKEGYSIIIFPEGTRSYDGKLKRFHKGAFYYAEKLKLDIIPFVLYGTGMIIAKAQPFYIKTGTIAIKALPRISADDTSSFGFAYKERTKNIALYFSAQYTRLCNEYNNVEDNPFFYNLLIKNYIYKGPVEEWYVRIKVRMEKSYKVFDSLIPKQAQVTDIGCGYGTLSYMLMMLSPNRTILGVDYDEDKIEVAQNGFLKNERINFVYADAANYDLPLSDVFVLNDVLHYMNSDNQRMLLKKCASLLKPEGLIIVRDGDSEDKEKQKVTRLSEIFSTRIFAFNKIEEKLNFISSHKMKAIAQECDMSVESFKNDKYTSNTIFLFKKKEQHE